MLLTLKRHGIQEKVEPTDLWQVRDEEGNGGLTWSRKGSRRDGGTGRVRGCVALASRNTGSVTILHTADMKSKIQVAATKQKRIQESFMDYNSVCIEGKMQTKVGGILPGTLGTWSFASGSFRICTECVIVSPRSGCAIFSLYPTELRKLWPRNLLLNPSANLATWGRAALSTWNQYLGTCSGCAIFLLATPVWLALFGSKKWELIGRGEEGTSGREKFSENSDDES
jgi:hypothetical protein